MSKVLLLIAVGWSYVHAGSEDLNPKCEVLHFSIVVLMSFVFSTSKYLRIHSAILRWFL